jgi:hypothetical protein
MDTLKATKTFNQQRSIHIMKHTFSKVMIASALGVAATSAMANQVSVVNASPNHSKPMLVTYQIAHQNPGKAPVFSSPTQLSLKDNEAVMVHVDPEHYQYSGLVILSVDDHTLPPSAIRFGQAETCTMATDENHPGGQLAMAYSGPTTEHGTLKCATHGGTTVS